MRLALAPKVVEAEEVEVAETGVEEVEVAEAGVDEDTVAAAEVADGVLGKGTSDVRASYYNFIKQNDNAISQSFLQHC